MKDKHENSIMGEERQRKKWMKHFEELLNKPCPQNPPEIPLADKDLPIDCSEPTKEEKCEAIKQLKSGKAAGQDNILALALKADVQNVVNLFYPLFKKTRKDRFQRNGKKVTSSSYQRKETLPTVITTEG